MQPSPRPYPSAAASRDFERPVGERAPSWAMWVDVLGTSIRFTPAATAAEVSPSSRPLCARWVATREDEQAVSMPMQGPAQQVDPSSAYILVSGAHSCTGRISLRTEFDSK